MPYPDSIAHSLRCIAVAPSKYLRPIIQFHDRYSTISGKTVSETLLMRWISLFIDFSFQNVLEPKK